MIDYVICAFRNLGRKRLRSVLTILGITVGVASVVIISSLGAGGKTAIASGLDSLGINGLNISEKSDADSSNNSLMTNSDVKLCEKVVGSNCTMPLIMQTGSAILNGIEKDALVWGIGSDAQNTVSLKLLHGKMFSRADIMSHAKVCLVDSAFAKERYKRENITGKTIYVCLDGDYVSFKVCGVVESGSSLLYNLVGKFIPTFVYLPYSAAEDMRMKKGYDQIVIKSASANSLDKTGTQIVNLLNKEHSTNDSYIVSNMLKQKEQFFSMLDIVTMIISAIGAISLVVAGIGIMTVMLVSVNERKREIGIKKAVGARKGVIMFEFLTEALVISATGGLCGIFSGLGIAYLAIKHMGLSFSINFTPVIGAFIFAVIIGIMFGVYPAYKAANLQPAEALRCE